MGVDPVGLYSREVATIVLLELEVSERRVLREWLGIFKCKWCCWKWSSECG